MDHLLNFHQFGDLLGTSGQPARSQFEQIAGEGYTAVVNLAMPDSDNAIAEEGGIVSSLGMSYFHIPVPFDRPEAEHLRKFMRVMDALEGEKVLVHCAVNARVSAFMYKYLTLIRGMSDEEASSPLLRRWLPEMDDAWRSILGLTLAELDA